MKREFIMTIVFDKQWNELGLTDDDLSRLQIELMTNPAIGDIINGTNGARKARFALAGKGKSAGIRVIYIDIVLKEQVYMILCYPKSRQDNLTNEQRKRVKELVEALKGAY